jgi:hypothetical protein
MPEKTQKQIDAEIKALEGCKEYAPHYTSFGDDNHRTIDLQIEFLRGDIDTTAEEFNEFGDDEQSSILHADDWKQGHSDESPSSGWDSYKNKKKK